MSTIKLLQKEEIEKALDIKIKNEKIWLEAILHKSWLYFHPQYKLPDNERLEFLGDSVLQTITSLYLYKKYPHLNEGILSLVRASLVNRERLGEIGKKLNIEKFLLVAKNISSKGMKTIIGNSLEAIIGAIFLDSGFRKAKKFVEKNILIDVDKIIREKTYKDAKTLLQEYLQKNYNELPKYLLIEESGLPHQKKFKVALYFRNEKISEGQGRSKQEAEFDAAEKALKILRGL
jgi:ribonuclease-3